MVSITVKRDGRKEEFDKSKISNAIKKAFIEVDGDIDDKAEAIVDKIANEIAGIKKEEMSVEDIQDMVEQKLMCSSRKDVAKCYILYRNERTKARDRNSMLIKTVAEKLTASNVQNQNANIDEHSFGGRIGEASDVVMKQYALDYCMSDMAKNNHLNNEIYIHDLNSYAIGMHNCLSIPFDKLLANGFNTRQTDVRPAQSVNTAMQLVAVIFQLQSLQQFGGVSATHLDHTMVPYVRKSFYKHYRDGVNYLEDKVIDDNINENMSIDDDAYKSFSEKAYKYAMDMTKREVYQSVEGMYHNLKY